MNLTEKARLIVAFSEEHISKEDYEEFFDYNDLGVPLAISLMKGYIKLRDAGEVVIAETWSDLCTTVNADPNGEYTNLDELTAAGKNASPRIDIQRSIELNNQGHQAFKSGDAGTALDYWKQASDMGQPNAITSLVWLNIMLNKFDQLDSILFDQPDLGSLGYRGRTENWRDQYDALAGDPSIGASQFDSQKVAIFYNSALCAWLSGDENRALAFLVLAGDGAEPEFLRWTINGAPVSEMEINEGQVAELIGIHQRAIEDFERIKEFDSSLIEPWDGKTLAQFAAQSIVVLGEYQPVNMTDTFVSRESAQVNLDIAIEDIGRPSSGEFAELMQNVIEVELGGVNGNSETSSHFQKELRHLSGNDGDMDASFLVGKVAIPSLNELQDLIEEYFIKVNQFSKSQRFFLYGFLSALPQESEIRSSLYSQLDSLTERIEQVRTKQATQEKNGRITDYEEYGRVDMLRFLLKYSEERLATQNTIPPAIEADLKTLNFDRPLIVQNQNGNWNDFVGIHSQPLVIPGKKFGELVDTAYSKYALGEFCGFDEAFVGECIADADVFEDAIHLLDDSELLPGIEFTDFANFVWADYWYPKFLLLAYANPSNVFVDDLKCDFVTHWQAGFETEMGIAPSAPRDLVQILRFTPRLLTLLSSSVYSAIYEDGNDAFINLFPALRLARPEATQAHLDLVIISYLEKANMAGSTNLLGELLDIDLELTEFFEVASACLHTKNTELLAKLSELDDEMTQICILLNPATSDEVLAKLTYTYEFLEGITFETGFSEDGTTKDAGEFSRYIAELALRCHDFDFAEAVIDRIQMVER